jgi:hypothetical protein
MSAETPDEILRYKGFRVEITGVDGSPTPVDTSWTSVTDGETSARVGEITLHGAMTDKRAALVDWINDTVAGGTWERTVTITGILFDGTPGEQHTFFECFPVRYLPPRLTPDPCGPLVEEVKFAYRHRATLPPKDNA